MKSNDLILDVDAMVKKVQQTVGAHTSGAAAGDAAQLRQRVLELSATDAEADVLAAPGSGPAPAFDETFYRALYPDVDQAVTAGAYASGHEHYLQHGQKEGRLARRVLADLTAALRARLTVAEAGCAAIGRPAPLPHTLRARFGAVVVRALQAILGWYSEQIRSAGKSLLRALEEQLAETRLLAELSQRHRRALADLSLYSVQAAEAAQTKLSDLAVVQSGWDTRVKLLARQAEQAQSLLRQHETRLAQVPSAESLNACGARTDQLASDLHLSTEETRQTLAGVSARLDPLAAAVAALQSTAHDTAETETHLTEEFARIDTRISSVLQAQLALSRRLEQEIAARQQAAQSHERHAAEAAARDAVERRLQTAIEALEALARRTDSLAETAQIADQRWNAEAAAREAAERHLLAEIQAREALAHRTDALAETVRIADQRLAAEATAREAAERRLQAELQTREAAEHLLRADIDARTKLEYKLAHIAALQQTAEARLNDEIFARDQLAGRLTAETLARHITEERLRVEVAARERLEPRLAADIDARERLEHTVTAQATEQHTLARRLHHAEAARPALEAELHAETQARQVTERRWEAEIAAREAAEHRLNAEIGARETLAHRVDAGVSFASELSEELRKTARAVHQAKAELAFQQQRVSLLLEEARKRLPAPFNPAQLASLVAESAHQLDAFYASFEDVFRGTREDIRERQRVYLPYIRQAGAGTPRHPVLDIGCGRGEWLELLKEESLVARGLDRNLTMLERCRELKLDVAEGDALAHLRQMPDAAFGAVTGFHIIEHIPFETLLALIDETTRVLMPGGLAIFETPNPDNLVVGANTFYTDPTHLRPLPSPMLRFIAESRGLCRVEILPLHPDPEAARATEITSGASARLNDYLYGPRDYAIIGWKA